MVHLPIIQVENRQQNLVRNHIPKNGNMAFKNNTYGVGQKKKSKIIKYRTMNVRNRKTLFCRYLQDYVTQW